ncbi:MAG: YcxB family protein [Lysobacterales bacterium]
MNEFLGFRIQYRVEQADYRLALQLACQQTASRVGGAAAYFWSNVAAWTFISLGVLQLLKAADTALSGPQRVWWAMSFVAAGGMAIWLSGIWRSQRLQATLLAVAGPFPSEQVLSVSDHGLRGEGPDGEALVRWSGIRAVQRLPGHVAIVLRPLSVLVIPRKAFESVELSDRFAEFLSERAGRSEPATAPSSEIG